MIRVLIADDHALVRHGISTLLEVYDDIEVVGEAENGKEAVEGSNKIFINLFILINEKKTNGHNIYNSYSNISFRVFHKAGIYSASRHKC
jgi:YesN/AraC family two-component response regulator